MLPDMPTARRAASALCVQKCPEAILVVGGADYLREAPYSAELLLNAPRDSGDAWQWRKLNEMQGKRSWEPGLLLLAGSGARQRVIVAGGGTHTAELLQFSCDDPSDCGQWTQLTSLTQAFYTTFIIELTDRIFTIGLFLLSFA